MLILSLTLSLSVSVFLSLYIYIYHSNSNELYWHALYSIAKAITSGNEQIISK